MGMAILIAVVLGCLCGFILYRNNALPSGTAQSLAARKVSVVVPARNEELNLHHLLESLRLQTLQPYEIIVVDDCSEDRTRAIAESYGVTVVAGTAPPPGWTGKNWAVWNGYNRSSGDVLVFLDADIRLAPEALSSLLLARERTQGVLSVVPYHRAFKLYEKLAMITNVLGVFAFTSPFERTNPRKGLYGACIVTSREHYETVNGHSSIKSEVLDDLFLGSQYMSAGIPVTNYLGRGLVSFRMYPGGLRSELEGFSKSAVLSTSTLRAGTIIPTALWVIGLLLSGCSLFVLPFARDWLLATGYLLYMLQLAYFIRSVGKFGVLIPALHVASSLFFVIMMAYSAYQVVVLRRVAWKGRHIEVGGKHDA